MVQILFCCRPGSIITDLSATLQDHPYAESIFFARLHSLNLNYLFPGGAKWDIPGGNIALFCYLLFNFDEPLQNTEVVV